jgi:hypothetical protein
VTLVKNLSSMRRPALALVLALLAGAGAARAQGKPNPIGDPALARLLAEIKSKDKGQLAVSEEDGRFMRLMFATSGAKPRKKRVTKKAAVPVAQPEPDSDTDDE